MKRPKKNFVLGRSAYRSLLIASLAVGGFLQFVNPLLATGTPAGTSISNRATATYADPNNPQNTINTTSNTVTVTVAEVAGITVTPNGVTDVNGGTVSPNDVIQYDFRITNVGNDPTRFVLPNTATITGTATLGTLQYSTDGGASFNDIPPGGFTTGLIPVNGFVIVRVPVTIGASVTAGANITVVYGDTGNNDNSAGTQNQPLSTPPSSRDVYTQDNPDGTSGEAPGSPVNGDREASASQQVTVNAATQAFAAVLKTRTNYTNSGTGLLNDDVLTYSLSLRVDSSAPAGSGLIPASLAGTSIAVDGTSAPHILLSDAIPTNTRLTGTPIAPTGWEIVYTDDPLSTTANDATWWTNPNAISGIQNATRIGFINTGTLTPGTTVSAFTFEVVTSGVTTTTEIANIAQLFGQTTGGTTLVYDESGDPNSNNYNDNGTPGSNTPTDGIADPPQNGIDTNNDNTGTGPGGEANVFTLFAPEAIENGPNGRPDAVGPTDTNDDFTNQSTPIAANTVPGSTIDPAPVTFTNTLRNPSSTATLTNVLLVPDDLSATSTVREDTIVTLTYSGQTAEYRYNGTDFVLQSGSVITIPTLAPGQSVDYTVQVNLPPGTPLSTDLNNNGNPPSFPVPIYAFVDLNGNNRPDPTDTTQNATIDRVYTGFLRLVKEARILDANGNELQGFPAPNNASISPGNIIEYRITYTNISMAEGSGNGNRILTATNVVITEDGTATPNNWAAVQVINGVPVPNNLINTSHVLGSALASNGSISYFPVNADRSGLTAADDVTRYENSLGTTIQPQASGTFIFRRRVN